MAAAGLVPVHELDCLGNATLHLDGQLVVFICPVRHELVPVWASEAAVDRHIARIKRSQKQFVNGS